MSKVFGEAKQDPVSGKWYYIIQSDDDQIFEKSDSIFNSQAEAEGEMLELLKGLKKLTDEYNAKK